jgi:hypothetical protein
MRLRDDLAPTLLLLAAWMALLGFFYLTGIYRYMVVWPMKPLFFDTWQVLQMGHCSALGIDVYRDASCGLLHAYGRLWLLSGKLGLEAKDATWIGPVVDLVFMLAVVWLLRPKRGETFAWSLLIIISPAVMLGMERANVDLLMFVLTVLAARLAHRREWSTRVGSACVIVFATALKIYPVAALADLVLSARRRQTFFTLLALSTGLLGVWLLLSYADLAQILKNIPQPEGRLTFGGEILFKRLGLEHPRATSLIAGVVMIAIALVLGRKIPLRGLDQEGIGARHYTFSFCILIFVFVVSVGYDYRLVFCIALLPLLLELTGSESPGSRLFARTLLIVMCYLMWSELFIELAIRSPQIGYINTPFTAEEHQRLLANLDILTTLEHALSWLFMFMASILMARILVVRGSLIQPLLGDTSNRSKSGLAYEQGPR